MAVEANQCLQGLDEWRRESLEKRKERWRERARGSLWVKVESSEEEEEETWDVGSEEEEVCEGKDEGEEEAGEKEEKREVKDEAEEMEAGDQREKENGFEKVQKQVEELEEARVEGEKELEGSIAAVKEEEQVEEEDEEEEHREQIGQYHHAKQLRKHMRRTQDEKNLQKRGSASQELRTVTNGEHLSDSVESDDEDSDLMRSDDGLNDFERINIEMKKDLVELEDPDEISRRNENNVVATQTSKETAAEDDYEKLTDEKKAVAESSCTTQEERFQVDRSEFQREEEESTDDEEAEHPPEEETGGNDEDVVKIYCEDDNLTDVFHTLTEFRDSSLLTDLTLSTKDGKSFHVHSPVLAAVSLRIRERLSQNNGDIERKDASVGLHRWSVSLGPEVDQVGLKAVVEFAYTGLILCLNQNTRQQIKAAAQTLGAPRVLDLCKEEEERSTKTGVRGKDDVTSAAEEMKVSLRCIEKLRMERVGCDVVLEALGGSLHVHRVILAVSSDYFRGMFTLGMKESHQPFVTLPFLLASELEALIDSSYSGALSISWKCVFEITSIALQLQYRPALSLCLNFLHREINPRSCLDVASFAEAYEMARLLEAADDFVLQQFERVACISKFNDLPAKKLLKYLNSRSLCVSSELVVFKAVVAWIQAKPRKRLKLAKELMKTIHFSLMTFKEFKEVLLLNLWSDPSLAELYETVCKDFCSKESQCRIYPPKESLVLIGGDQISEDLGSRSISRELWFVNSLRNHTGIKKDMEWRKLAEMPEPERFSHEVAVLKGKLYVFGGKKYYGTSDNLSSVYRFDPYENSWESLAEMQEKRCSFSVVVLDGKIYAIGGHRDLEYIESVERYCPTGNSWSFTRPLHLPLAGHVAKALQGRIFVSGGLSRNFQCLASMFLYHPETGSTHLANMAEPRARHCMQTLAERLYVAGGITVDDNARAVDQLACEVYDPVDDSWTAFASLPVPHVGAGGAVLEGKFFVLGGYSQDDYSDTGMVHRYDPTAHRWENMGRMPGPNNDTQASVLRLPQDVRL
ncbi:kelch-like protein 26 [Clinocottus analis]|uniref:kelch-like protein 26 n=1 Tax=Clinocottus analis TaxID=304258 RepID=UPI0035BF2AA4